jgi:hypothetical protein
MPTPKTPAAAPATPTFTHVVVKSTDTALLQELYNIGKREDVNPELACAPFPYPLLADLTAAANDPDRILLAVYADGVLRMGQAFTRDEGIMGLYVIKAYTPQIAAGTATNEGLAMALYTYKVIRDITGGKLGTYDPNPGNRPWYDANGIVVVETATPPVP